MKDSEVKVVLFRKSFNTGYFQVRLQSHTRPSLYSETKLHFENSIIEDEMAKAVETAGGALAEYQCEHYGDAHDPSACAAAAKEAYYDLLADLRLGPKSR